jgi:hypothetical protein
MAFRYGSAGIEIVRCKVRVAHGHLQRLVAEPHLHPPDIKCHRGPAATRRYGAGYAERPHRPLQGQLPPWHRSRSHETAPDYTLRRGPSAGRVVSGSLPGHVP